MSDAPDDLGIPMKPARSSGQPASLLGRASAPLPPGNIFFVFLGRNGYRSDRESFEVVALRRLDGAAIRPVCQRVGGHLPCVGMARRFEGLRRIEPYLLAS